MLHIRRFQRTDRVPPAQHSPRYETKSVLDSLDDLAAEKNLRRRPASRVPTGMIGAAIVAGLVAAIVVWMGLSLPVF
jgi:hypothetical protein